MPHFRIAMLMTLFLPFSACSLYRSPDIYTFGDTLVWSQEFDGGAIDVSYWNRETGGGGWGNNEWEEYTSGTENAFIENGDLVIRALSNGSSYTSARLNTKGKVAFQYGRLEARIRLPEGKGIWPAFWMLGTNFNGSNWPDCGEIDIMEFLGHEKSKVHGTVHGPGYSGVGGNSKEFNLPDGASFSDGFHLFRIDWEPESIRWYVDGVEYHHVKPSDIPIWGEWRFDRPFFLLLNVAVGGNWPGNPDSSTRFPVEMRVDYLRYYR